MNRTGKIARLPRQLREKINQRLENNEPFEPILAWLNPLPEVQVILKDQFAGLPISKQNLSEWRKGGYVEWELRRDIVYDTAETKDDGWELETLTGGFLADRLGVLITARYNSLVRSWLGDEPTDEFKAKLKVMRVLVQDVSLLRRWDHSAATVALAEAKHTEQLERAHRQEMEKAQEKAAWQKQSIAFLKDLAAARQAQTAASPAPTSTPSTSSMPSMPSTSLENSPTVPSAAAPVSSFFIPPSTFPESDPVKPSQTTFPTALAAQNQAETTSLQPLAENKPVNPTTIPATGDSQPSHPADDQLPAATPPTPVPAEVPVSSFSIPPSAFPASPCIGVCKNDGGGHCLGCLRSIPEVLRWPVMPLEQKRQCLEHLTLRRRKKERSE